MSEQDYRDFFDEAERILAICDPVAKCAAIADLNSLAQQIFTRSTERPSTPLTQAKAPACALHGYPAALKLVAPRDLKRRGLATQEGRNVLIHAVAHIEYNAMNLALDAAFRFRDMPDLFYRDWLYVAADEARHFELLRHYLNHNECEYGDYVAHNGLWEMAEKTAHDVVARMALVPRVMEARGLDVTPAMIKRLERVNDHKACAALEVIYQDEINHVKIGSSWYAYTCKEARLEPRSHFLKLVDHYLHGELRGPFNLPARLKAGFAQEELDDIQARYSQPTR